MTFESMTRVLFRQMDNLRQQVNEMNNHYCGLTDKAEKLSNDLRQLSDAYLRLRQKIPGAFDTPYAPSPRQVWETTEKALDDLLKEAGK